MSAWPLHRRQLKRLGIPPPPPPYTASAWAAKIAGARGRPLHVVDWDIPADQAVAWCYPQRNVDVVYRDQSASEMLRDQGLLHELVHLVAGHDGAQVDGLTFVDDPAEEREAERTAELMACWLARAGQPRQRRTLTGWVRRRATYWWVHRLWMDLQAAAPPDLDLAEPGDHDGALPAIGADRTYYRTIIGVHDGLRRLRPYVSEQVRSRGIQRATRAGRDSDAARTVGDAAAVAVALRQARTGTPAARPTALVERSAETMDGEAQRLAAIARAIRESPHVAAEVVVANVTR
ncbi:DUF6545 domain-containing protein [Micromonospora echinospora]